MLSLLHSLVLSKTDHAYNSFFFLWTILLKLMRRRYNLDIKKAFDTVPHNRLLSQLWSSGIVGNIWKFSKVTFIIVSNMYQFKVRHQIFSQFPQEFLRGVYWDLSYLSSILTLYLLLFTTIQSLSDCHLNFQSDLNHLSDWSNSISDLTFNLSKTFLLRFSSRKDKTLDFSYTIGSLPVCLVNSCKDLGIIISSDLSWSQYFSKSLPNSGTYL